MSRPRNPVPTYRLHKQSGQAVVTLRLPDGSRKDVLLGPYGSPESQAEYRRVLAEWQASGGRAVAPSGLTVNELILAYWRHVEQHYRRPDGTPTNEQNEYRLVLRAVRAMYGHTAAADFGPLALKAVRQRMVESGLCRGVINQRVGRVKRMFKWAVGEELVPHGVYAALATVAGLAKGRSAARETEPVRPAPEAFVDAVLPLVRPPVAAMIEVQRLTGARPGEVCRMRAKDLDTSGPIWLFRPARHKTEYRGRCRVIAVGPRAQAVIKPFLGPDLGACLFAPARGTAHYTNVTYAKAVGRACRKAGVPPWSPNRLRHNHATEVRRRFGLEAAGAALGHARMSATEIYAERDLALALKVAAAVG
jgi:integrase